nr:MAG TPA: hypothetical protein [Caudoviricetes sp.]
MSLRATDTISLSKLSPRRSSATIPNAVPALAGYL